MVINPLVSVQQNENVLNVTIADPQDLVQKALWGTNRKLIANMVEGVSKGFEKKLEVNGVGYSTSASGNKLTLSVGYSHPVVFTLPQGLAVVVEKNIITVSGIDKQLVGDISAQIRKIRPPEPYKGKGIKYIDEQIRRKAGKSAKTAA